MGGRYIISEAQINSLRLNAQNKNLDECINIIKYIEKFQLMQQSYDSIENDITLLRKCYHMSEKLTPNTFLITGFDIKTMLCDENFKEIISTTSEIKETQWIGHFSQPIKKQIEDIQASISIVLALEQNEEEEAMGGRYIITDVQFGLLRTHADANNQIQCEKLINSVAEKQWIGHSLRKLDEDIEALRNLPLDKGQLTEIYVITGVEIGLILADIQHENFTKIMIDIHNLKKTRLIHKTNRPINEHVDETSKCFSNLENVIGEEIFEGIDNEKI